MQTVSAKQMMLKALKKSDVFTVAQARERFGVKNVAARIEELRKEGYCIFTEAKQINGKKEIMYRLGTPTKAVIRAAALAGGFRCYA